MKKAISLICLSALLLTNTACGQDNSDDNTEDSRSSDLTADDSTEVETVDERYLIKEELPERDFGGYTFTIHMRHSQTPVWANDMFSDGESGDVVSDAVYRRNLAVSERFNVNFELALSTTDPNYNHDARPSILAGDDVYDLVAAHGNAAFDYAREGLCLDYRELEYIDLDKPWWDQDAKESFTINDKLYVMVGDFSHMSLAYTDALLFNKNLFDEYNLEYPYQTVLDGDWTFDEFSELAKQCSEDLNGDGLYKPEDDLFGYISYQWIGPINTIVSGGGRIVDKDESGELVLSVNTERNQDLLSDYMSLYDSQFCYVEGDRNAADHGYFNELDCRMIFGENRALFCDANIIDVEYLRNMTDDFGIIPYPKYDEEQERYYTTVDAGTNLYFVPVTASDPERTSIILEALAAEGYREVIPAYYEVALQTKYTRDDLSVQMLDLIKESRVFDIGYYIYNGPLSYAGKELYWSSDRGFASFYAKNESAANVLLDEINETYGK